MAPRSLNERYSASINAGVRKVCTMSSIPSRNHLLAATSAASPSGHSTPLSEEATDYLTKAYDVAERASSRGSSRGRGTDAAGPAGAAAARLERDALQAELDSAKAELFTANKKIASMNTRLTRARVSNKWATAAARTTTNALGVEVATKEEDLRELTAALKHAEDEVESEAEQRLAAEGELAQAADRMARADQQARAEIRDRDDRIAALSTAFAEHVESSKSQIAGLKSGNKKQKKNQAAYQLYFVLQQRLAQSLGREFRKWMSRTQHMAELQRRSEADQAAAHVLEVGRDSYDTFP